MAQPFVRGPAHCFVGIGPGQTPVYLGTAERSPRIQIRPSWSPVFNDIAGQKVPFDWSFDGEEGYVVYDFTRWNEAVWEACQTRPFPPIAGGITGTNVAGDIGTLMLTEGAGYPLWILFPYTLKLAYATQPLGYHFFRTWLMGPDDLDENNTSAARIRGVWYCSRAPTLNIPAAGLNFSLYDGNMAGLPPID